MDQLIYLGFAVLEMTKVFKYETYYDKLSPQFGRKKLQFHYIDKNSFVLKVSTEDIIKDLKNPNDLFSAI